MECDLQYLEVDKACGSSEMFQITRGDDAAAFIALLNDTHNNTLFVMG
jgi:hypothetical protein